MTETTSGPTSEPPRTPSTARARCANALPSSGKALFAASVSTRPARQPAEQADPQIGLEQPDLLADRRRGHRQLVGRLDEALVPCGGLEGAQRGERRQAPVHGRRSAQAAARRASSSRSAALRVRDAARSNSRLGLSAGARAWPAGRRARWAAGGSGPAPARPPGPSTSASPAAGPCGHPDRHRPVQLDHRRRRDAWRARRRAPRSGPSRWRPPVACPGMAGRDRGLQRVRPARTAQELGAPQRREPAPDQQPVPAPAVLVGQQHRRAVRADARLQPRGLQLHQRHEPVHLRLVGRQLRQDPPQPQRLVAQRRPHPVLARGGGVALVEDEVDHLQHRGQPRRQLVPARHLERHARPASASASRARSAAPPWPRAPGRRARSRAWSARTAAAG